MTIRNPCPRSGKWPNGDSGVVEQLLFCVREHESGDVLFALGSILGRLQQHMFQSTSSQGACMKSRHRNLRQSGAGILKQSRKPRASGICVGLTTFKIRDASAYNSTTALDSGHFAREIPVGGCARETSQLLRTSLDGWVSRVLQSAGWRLF